MAAGSGYEHADAPDFELYDESYDPADPPNSVAYIYWPLK
jgi:predicted transcriptional regulator YdeE